ncbi:uncharacterized protein LOC133297715 [Gastrolobium bilobum]|uniref:uncharacterized protein LOC133297715 n=1 Tax=Gastrolobium bilobum TaxID=150636 RepID=UPI002AAF2524|nr:uncharacterized protein LOC133297715 [Gastrolobium bilobum]
MSRPVPKFVHSLERIRQQSGESLRSFLDQFDKESLLVQGLDPKVQVHILISGLRQGAFAYELARHEITDLEEEKRKAQEFMRVKEYKGSRAEDNQSRERKTSKSKDQGKDERKGHKPSTRYPGRPLRRGNSSCPTHNVMQTEYKSERRTNATRQKTAREPAIYYKFHRSSHHSTEECRSLREEIDELIKGGAPRRYVNSPHETNPPRRHQERSRSPKERTVGKAEYRARRERNRREESSRTPRERARPANREQREPEDSAIIKHGMINMISGVIANFGVNRVFIDHGSSADILFLPCLKALGYSANELSPIVGELSGFNATVTKPHGMINLRLSMGAPPASKSVDIQFFVLDTPSAYNAILGRRMFAAFEASVSHPHLALKFVARDNKVATIKRDRTLARSCYNITLRPPPKVTFNDQTTPSRMQHKKFLRAPKIKGKSMSNVSQ